MYFHPEPKSRYRSRSHLVEEEETPHYARRTKSKSKSRSRSKSHRKRKPRVHLTGNELIFDHPEWWRGYKLQHPERFYNGHYHDAPRKKMLEIPHPVDFMHTSELSELAERTRNQPHYHPLRRSPSMHDRFQSSGALHPITTPMLEAIQDQLENEGGGQWTTQEPSMQW